MCVGYFFLNINKVENQFHKIKSQLLIITFVIFRISVGIKFIVELLYHKYTYQTMIIQKQIDCIVTV